MANAKSPRGLPAIAMAFGLAMSVVCGNASAQSRVPANDAGAVTLAMTVPPNMSGRSYADTTILPTTKDESIALMLSNQYEGCGVNENDNGHGVSKCGVVGRMHGLTQGETRNLTAETAAPYYDSYWQETGIDNLPPQERFPAFNAAVQFGIGRGNQIIEAAKGNVDDLLALSAKAYASSPASSEIHRAWNKRLQKIERGLEGDGSYADEQSRVLHAAYGGDRLPRNRLHVRPAVYDPTKDAPFMERIAGGNADRVSSNYGNNNYDIPTLKKFGYAGLGVLGFAIPAALLLGALGARERRKLLAENTADARKSFYDDPPASSNRPFEPEPAATRSPSATSPSGWLSEKEQASFDALFGSYPFQILEEGRKRQVDFSASDYLTVERNLVAVTGKEGIELSLLHAARSWGGENCRFSCDKPDQRDYYVALYTDAAQKLVDQGDLPAGFMIEGIGAFTPTVRPASGAALSPLRWPEAPQPA